jgi:SPP1 family phage portal protein
MGRKWGCTVIIDKMRNNFGKYGRGTQEIIKKIVNESGISEKQFLEIQIKEFLESDARKEQITGNKYYNGYQDILRRKREVIDGCGHKIVAEYLPNNIIIDNVFSKLVAQKVNYLLGKPLAFESEDKLDESYTLKLRNVLNEKFMNTFRSAYSDAIICGIGWIFPYIESNGEIAFRRFSPYEILPFWRDENHQILDIALRIYEVEDYSSGINSKTVKKVELYTADKIEVYTLENNYLIFDRTVNYITDNLGKSYSWGELGIPLIAVRHNSNEIPLIRKLKSIQDSINLTISDFMNSIETNAHNSLLVIKGYAGSNADDVRNNISKFGIILLDGDPQINTDVSALNIDVNVEHYKSMLDTLKRSAVENAMGFDAKNEKIGSNPNEMNLQSAYSDIDLDANGAETELQQALSQVLRFVNISLGVELNTKIKVIFNRDMMMNEESIANTIVKYQTIVSQETLLSQVPFIDDPVAEMERIKKENNMYDEQSENETD